MEPPRRTEEVNSPWSLRAYLDTEKWNSREAIKARLFEGRKIDRRHDDLAETLSSRYIRYKTFNRHNIVSLCTDEERFDFEDRHVINTLDLYYRPDETFWSPEVFVRWTVGKDIPLGWKLPREAMKRSLSKGRKIEKSRHDLAEDRSSRYIRYKTFNRHNAHRYDPGEQYLAHKKSFDKTIEKIERQDRLITTLDLYYRPDETFWSPEKLVCWEVDKDIPFRVDEGRASTRVVIIRYHKPVMWYYVWPTLQPVEIQFSVTENMTMEFLMSEVRRGLRDKDQSIKLPPVFSIKVYSPGRSESEVITTPDQMVENEVYLVCG